MTSSNHHIMLFIYNTYSSVYRELLVSEAGKSSIKSKENSVIPLEVAAMINTEQMLYFIPIILHSMLVIWVQ